MTSNQRLELTALRAAAHTQRYAHVCMRSIRERVRKSVWPQQALLIFLGLSLIRAGLASLRERRLHYPGGSIFAPLAIALGVFAR